ncbi:hypothetical protein HWC29_gp124 [Aeromonas phage 4_4572]|uniref:Uncharacterized protein n=1 Tax=Aeromonas phage 4_4572 TaxID=2588517 RepID=A0A5B9N9B2_9CAUD|nr:hypothetical protein HWC29_gp124 [Aeromonas phage 4_4572]QEG09062.1 hypothetical protein [Aeromonas phage 4_4572]
MNYITDPDLLKELNRGYEPPASPTANPTDSAGEEDPGWFLGEGGLSGVGRAAGQRVLSGLAHIAATSTTDPDASNYSKRVGRQAAREALAEESKLGTVGRFAAAGAQYAPAIGAGMVNPIAGAGIASGMSYGDILSEQDRLRGEYDPQSAKLGAAATGVIDLASGGLGSKFAGLARRPVQKIAAEVVEDAASSAGSQVATNLAAGKDWQEGYAEALLGGAAFGQGLRGLNRAGQYVVNKAGEKAIKDTVKIQSDHKVNLDPTFADNFTEYSNAAEALKQKAREAVTPDERAESISAFTNLSAKNAGEAAKMNAYILATDNNIGLTDAAFNYNYTSDLGRTGAKKFAGMDFNLSPEAVGKTAALNEEARPSVLRNQKAKVAGETRESHFKQVQEKGTETLNKVLGNFHANQTSIDNRIDELVGQKKLDPWSVSDDTLTKYEDLSSTLSNLSTLSNSYLAGKDVSSKIERQSRRAMELATELGEIDNLKGFDGKPGSFNPIMDVMTASHLEKMLTSEYPAFHHGVPQVSREKAGVQPSGAQGALGLGTMILAPAAMPLVATRALVRRGAELAGATKSQRRIRKAKETTAKRGAEIAEFARQIQAKQPTVKESAVDEAIVRGDPEVAARASESALADEGIIVPEPSIKRVTPEENERLWREAGIARQPARIEPTIEPTPEPIAEPTKAPTISPEVMAKPRKETGKERRKRERYERRAAREVQAAPDAVVETPPVKRAVDTTAARKPTKPVSEAPTEVVDEITTVTKKAPDQRAARKPTKPAPVEEVPIIKEEPVVTPEPTPEVAPRREVDLEMAKAKKTAPVKEEVVEPVEEPTVTESRVKAEDVSRAPRKPVAEEVVEPEPTPRVEEETAPEATPERKFVDLVTKPMRARIEELEKTPSGKLDRRLATELGSLREKERTINRTLEDVAREEKVSQDVVARHLHDAGGLESLGPKFKAELKASIKAEKSRITQEARQKAKDLKAKLAEESRARREEKKAQAQNEVEAEKARKKAEIEAESAKKDLEKAKATTGFSTMAQAKETLTDLAGKNAPEDVKKIIDNFTREVTGSDKGPTVAQMRSTINKIIELTEKAKKAEIDLAKAEKKRYEEWLEKGQADFTVDEAAYKARKDQLQQRLKKNLEQAKRDKGPRTLVQKEIERIQKEHNKEVKRLDEWLKRGSLDRTVQEAEFKQKAAEIKQKLQDYDKRIEANKKYAEKVDKTDRVIANASEKVRITSEAAKPSQKAPESKPKEDIKEEVKRAEEATQKEFDKATEEELREVAKHYSSEYLDSDMSPDDLAQTAGIMKGISKETSDDKVKAVTTELSKLFEEAAIRKAEFPDNPETWITSDMFNRVKAERFGDADQSWVGSLAQNLTKSIMGKGVQPNKLKTESEVKKLIADKERFENMSPEEKASLKSKTKASGALAGKARAKGISQAPKKKGRLIEFVG